MFGTKNIYLDHSATTPVRPEVLAAMLPHWTEGWGNPSSIHQQGRCARRALEDARRSIARQLNARSKEIIFTGCGSESDNLALRGVMMAARAEGHGDHLITSCIEHKAILDTAKQLRDVYGFEITILPVDKFGRVRLEDVEQAIRPTTTLISIMAASNEVGTVQDVEGIGRLAHTHNILFHTDAVQAISTTPWDMQTQPIDLMSLAPHKFNGPKGIGILYKRDGVTLTPSMTGGGQEGGLRPGTSNVAFAAGAAKALEIAQTERDTRNSHYLKLRDTMIERTLSALGNDCILTGHPTERLPFHVSIALRGLRGNDLLMHLDLAGISASSGSACSVGNPEPSAILRAMGLGDEWATGGLRFSFGCENTLEDVEFAVEALTKAVQNLKLITAKYH